MAKKIICCKILQLFSDTIFFIIGLASITALFLAKTDKLTDSRLVLGEACLESDSSGFVLVVIVWGAILASAVTLNSVLGIFSCLRQKWGLLYCYSMVGHVLVLLELLYFLTVYTHLARIIEHTSVCLDNVLVEFYTGPFKSVLKTYSGAWDYLHRSQRCCGVNGGKVFNSMVNWDRSWLNKFRDPFFNTSIMLEEFRVITVLPYTCCKFKDEKRHGKYNPEATVADVVPLLVDEDCPSNPDDENSYINASCLESVSHFVVNLTTVVFAVSNVLEVMQLFACLGALYTSRATQNIKMRGKLKKKGMIR